MNARNDKTEYDAVDATIQKWRQGDCVLGEQWFAHRFDPDTPLTDESSLASKQGADIAEVEVGGMVIVSQTCDIVRSCRDRPYVEIAPLVEVDPRDLESIAACRRPQYAHIPNLSKANLVADLDRVMTVEKAVVATWDRTSGCATDAEARTFARALSRKRVRFAFPDDFTQFARKLQERLKRKHEKQTPEGAALRSLREIRVRAAPSWNDDRVEVMFWFIRHEIPRESSHENWAKRCRTWLELVPAGGRFHLVYGEVTTLSDMTARDYIESDPLDLDHLSPPGRSVSL